MGLRKTESASTGISGCPPYTASLHRVMDYSKKICKTLEGMVADYTYGDPRREALLYAIGLCRKDIIKMENEVKQYD